MGYESLFLFFLNTGFEWPTPELFDKIGAAHSWSDTEKTSDPPPNQKQLAYHLSQNLQKIFEIELL